MKLFSYLMLLAAAVCAIAIFLIATSVEFSEGELVMRTGAGYLGLLAFAWLAVLGPLTFVLGGLGVGLTRARPNQGQRSFQIAFVAGAISSLIALAIVFLG